MNEKLKNRMKKLESEMLGEPLVVFMADGSKTELPGKPEFVLGLMTAAMADTATPEQQQQMELIARSERIREPGGGHLCDLVRLMVHGPVRTEHTVIPIDSERSH